MPGSIDSIYLATSHGDPQRPVDAGKLTVGIGLEGDRYANVDGGVVSLIEAEAVAAFEANIHRGGPTALPGNCAAAAAYVAAGELEKAERMARLVLEEMPNFTVSGWQRPYWWKEQLNNDRFLSALIDAGLPE